MPTESDGQSAKGIPVPVQAAPMPAAVPNTGVVGGFSPERVDLPTGPAGPAVYPNSPARAGYLNVRPITTKEEEILATPRFWMQGNALDLVMSRCILTPGVNTLDLVSGDRTHLLMYLRAISYGPKYKFEATMRDGSRQVIETDVSQLGMRQLDSDFIEPYVVQLEGVTYELKLSRGHQEQAIIQARLRAKKRDPKNAAEVAPSEALKQIIVSVNGEQDPKLIAQHVDTMVAGKAYHLRKIVGDKAPGPLLDLEVTNEQTGDLEKVSFQMTEAFFRPSTDE